MMHVTCNVKGREIRLKNPLMTAPGSFGNILEYKDFVDLEKLGALIPNSMLKEDGSPNLINKFLMVPHGYLSSFGPNNMGVSIKIIQGKLKHNKKRFPIPGAFFQNAIGNFISLIC